MPRSEILTIAEIDAFARRMRATALVAAESEALKEALRRLARGSGGGLGHTLGRDEANVSGEESNGAERPRGRRPRVPSAAIVELLREGGDEGMGMRALERALGQHAETIRLKLRELRAGGLVTTSGPRNQLRYHAAAVDAPAPARAKRSDHEPRKRART